MNDIKLPVRHVSQYPCDLEDANGKQIIECRDAVIASSIRETINSAPALLAERDALREALAATRMLVIEHHEYKVMREEHQICPICSTAKGDLILNRVASVLALAKGGGE